MLRLLHRIGQRAWNPALVCMYDNMQQSLQDFYCTYQEGGKHEHDVDILINNTTPVSYFFGF